MRIPSMIRVNADRIGDIAGIVAIVVIIIAGIWIGHGLDLSTGGDELLQVVR